MTCTLVDASLGNPRAALSRLDVDAAELGEALWSEDGQPEPLMTAALPGAFGSRRGPVLLVDVFELDPEWCGTAFTPWVALQALAGFSSFVPVGVALTAGPVVGEDEEMSDADRDRVAQRIAAMWERVGFRRDPGRYEGGNVVMVQRFEVASLAERIGLLAEEMPTLASLGTERGQFGAAA